MLQRLSIFVLENNLFTGALPSLNGLVDLEQVFLDHNNFTEIPNDFLHGLPSLISFALDANPFLNGTSGWTLPIGFQDSPKLTNLSMKSCNLVGLLPDYLGGFIKLNMLKLSFNRLSGGIPRSFSGSNVQILWLNGQNGDDGGLTGALNIMTTMESLKSVQLDSNKFSGTIPPNIGDLASLKQLHLKQNQLTGFIPIGLAHMRLEELDISHNNFLGPIPVFNATSVFYASNSFCGIVCAPEVMTLLDFLSGVNFPATLSESWTTNDPCEGWLGVKYNDAKQVSVIHLPNNGLNGTLSPFIANLGFLRRIILRNNNLTGHVPTNWTSLRHLAVLDLGNTNLSPPWPKFGKGVQVNFPHAPSPTPGSDVQSSPPNRPKSKKSKLVWIVPVIASITAVGLFAVFLFVYYCRMNKHVNQPPTGSTFVGGSNIVMSLQVLRNVTNNFASENVVGRGGFGVVYKGQLEDGTEIAVKRKEGGVIRDEPLDEFGAELAFLSNVRHRHLVSFLGYSMEGSERILVYEYMTRGDLSKHLFEWKSLNLEPLSWKRRLIIALDVARGMEYLHSLAHESFIHRDLKSSNILLSDDFRAKVSDIGLVKLAPNQGQQSVATKVMGTIGYLAPEYAATRRITTKADVYSFGVVLVELLTGLKALDHDRPEEQQSLALWFWGIKSDREKILAIIDPVLDKREEDTESFFRIAELADHYTTREANQRPDMSHVVSVLALFVEGWKPRTDEIEEAGTSGIDYNVPLNKLLKGWQEEEENT